MPARRGRGGSEGQYDEGFAPDRSSGCSCEPALSIAGADRALRDMDAATVAILAMQFVDRNRVVIGGQSRGGILSVAYAGQHPAQIKGVINFVGGWMSTRCVNASPINQALFTRGMRSVNRPFIQPMFPPRLRPAWTEAASKGRGPSPRGRSAHAAAGARTEPVDTGLPRRCGRTDLHPSMPSRHATSRDRRGVGGGSTGTELAT